MSVTVSFVYHPDDPDPSDRTGMSEAEYLELTEKLMDLGGEDISIRAVPASDGGVS